MENNNTNISQDAASQKVKKSVPVWFPILVSALLSGTVFGLAGYYLGKQQTVTQSEQIAVSPFPQSTTQPTETESPGTTLSLYTNSKHGYTLLYPDGYHIGSMNVMIGKFEDATGTENTLDILSSLNEEYNNFLQVQVVDKSQMKQTLPELVKDLYTQQKEHFQTTDITPLVPTKFQGLDSFEYSFTGQALNTPNWSGVITEGRYKAILFEKNKKIYALYLKDNQIFNEILSSFKLI